MKTRQQVAQDLGISPQTLHRWMKKAEINFSGRMLTPDDEINLYKALGMHYRAKKLILEYKYE